MEWSKEDMRGLVFEVVTEVVGGLQKHLDQQMLELQVDVETALEKLTDISLDTRDVQRQEARLSREWIKMTRREADLRKRVEILEREVVEVKEAKGAG